MPHKDMLAELKRQDGSTRRREITASRVSVCRTENSLGAPAKHGAPKLNSRFKNFLRAFHDRRRQEDQQFLL